MLTNLYQGLLDQVSSMAKDATPIANFGATMGDKFQIQLSSMKVVDGVSAPYNFLTPGIVQALAVKFLSWTKRRNLYGSKSLSLFFVSVKICIEDAPA